MNQSYYQLTYAFGPSGFTSKKTGFQFYSKKGKKYVGFVGNHVLVEKIGNKGDSGDNGDRSVNDSRRYIQFDEDISKELMSFQGYKLRSFLYSTKS